MTDKSSPPFATLDVGEILLQARCRLTQTAISGSSVTGHVWLHSGDDVEKMFEWLEGALSVPSETRCIPPSAIANKLMEYARADGVLAIRGLQVALIDASIALDALPSARREITTDDMAGVLREAAVYLEDKGQRTLAGCCREASDLIRMTEAQR